MAGSHSSPEPPPGYIHNVGPRAVVTDITVKYCSAEDCSPDMPGWTRLRKELYLHTNQHTAWLLIAQADDGELGTEDMVVTDVRVCELMPPKSWDAQLSGVDLTEGQSTTSSWERRPAGIWVARRKKQEAAQYSGGMTATEIDVLFGVDAVDPRPQWTLLQQPLQLPGAQPEVPVPRLTIRYSSSSPDLTQLHLPESSLRANSDGTFKIVQISDTHMVTGVGKCSDAIDANGEPLPPSEADPLTIKFLGAILDLEKPDLVILAGDQLHHDIQDSQTTLFKVVAPLIERRIPYATVYGNHDSEGEYAMSREFD